MTFNEAERALDAGTLEMMRPWKDWVAVRRKTRTYRYWRNGWRYCDVHMEASVIGNISERWDSVGQPYLRIRKEPPG